MTRLKTWMLLVVVLILVAAACGDDDGPSAPPATQPPATQPPATQPPATQPPATQPPATQPPATQPPATTTEAPRDPDKVSVILDWLMEASYAPLLYGIDQGIFAKHGIEVDVIAGMGSDLAMSQINEGQVDFAFTDLETYLVQRASGDTDTMLVHAWLNQATIGVASLEPIENPADMVGLTFGTIGFSSGRFLLPFVLEANGVDSTTVGIELLDFSVLYPSFLSGEYETAEAHVPGSAEGLIANAAKQGVTVYVKLLSDWGLRSYSKMLIVPNETIANNPDLVSRFVAAVHESLIEAMANATDDQIASLLVDFDQQIDGELQKQVWDSFKRIVIDPGPSDPSIIQETLDRLVALQGLEHTLVVDDLFDNGYIPGS